MFSYYKNGTVHCRLNRTRIDASFAYFNAHPFFDILFKLTKLFKIYNLAAL